jgi:hypothetical protein
MKKVELERRLRVIRKELQMAEQGSAVKSRLSHSIGRITNILSILQMESVDDK